MAHKVSAISELAENIASQVFDPEYYSGPWAVVTIQPYGIVKQFDSYGEAVEWATWFRKVQAHYIAVQKIQTANATE